MRISTAQMNFNGIEGFRKHAEALYNIQEKLSSGKRVNTPGDDPIAAARIYTVDKSIKQMNQFGTNANFAQTRLELEDTTLTNTLNVMQRVRELAIYGMNGTQTQVGRKEIAAEMRGLMENLKSLVNTQDSNGEYIFAGDQTNTPAYQAVTANNVHQLSTGLKAPQPTAYFTVGDGSSVTVNKMDGSSVTETLAANQIIDNFNGKVFTLNATTNVYEDDNGEALFAYTGSHTGSRFIQVSPDGDHKDNGFDAGDASRVRISDMGANVFGFYDKSSSTPYEPNYDLNKNPQMNYHIFDTMREMIAQFESTDPGVGNIGGNTKYDDFIVEIDAMMGSLKQGQTEVGTRLERLDMQHEMNETFKLGLEKNLSLLQDQDMISGINEYQKILVSLQMAQQTFAKMSELSLFNYIR